MIINRYICLLVIKKSDEELIKRINEHKIFNFAAINKMFSFSQNSSSNNT